MASNTKRKPSTKYSIRRLWAKSRILLQTFSRYSRLAVVVVTKRSFWNRSVNRYHFNSSLQMLHSSLWEMFGCILPLESFEKGLSSLSSTSDVCLNDAALNDSDVEFIQGVLDESSDEDIGTIEWKRYIYLCLFISNKS